ncbi:MAG: hypothetical protein GF372_10785 [Candidatus Marinimicrobia bacterium]|nr:hypothetical protein [Candidatus Neomarinimicrobiota bacterium]
MNLIQLITQLQKLYDESDNANFMKAVGRVISLLKEIDTKDITDDEKVKIQTSISPYLGNIKTEKDAELNLKRLRKSLENDFGFVSSNYYLALGIGIGLGIGTALGITFGVPFENGIVFGPMVGSGIGLIGGLFIGGYLDMKKEAENRVLKNL